MQSFFRPLGKFIAPLMVCVGVAGAGLAHDGHAPSEISVAVLDTHVTENGLTLTLSFANTGHIPVEIAGIASDLGVIHGLDLPHYVLAGDTDIFTTTLESEADIPGIFTLFIDLGELGAGPVIVMPDV